MSAGLSQACLSHSPDFAPTYHFLPTGTLVTLNQGLCLKNGDCESGAGLAKQISRRSMGIFCSGIYTTSEYYVSS
jgi:hypothetical protein